MRPLCASAPLALTLLAACSSTPPPHWAEGGARLMVGEAVWRTGEGDTVEIQPSGKVLGNGEELFTIDGAGRVYDPDNEPVAILLPDGNVVGPNDVHLGRIGLSNAAPPGSGTAWLSVLPDGRIVHFDPDGDR